MIEQLFFLAFIWFLFILGTKMKNYVMTAFGCLLIMVFGFYGIGNNLLALDEVLSYALALSHIGLGLYFIARQSEELLKLNKKGGLSKKWLLGRKNK